MLPIRKSENWLPSIFNDFFDNEHLERFNATTPAVNVVEHEHNYCVEVAAPGMTKDDFRIDVDEENNLVITMEKKTENKQEDKKNGHYLRHEFSYSKFRQALLLPDNVDKDKITASVEHGVLTVDIPKLPEEKTQSKVRSIEVK